MSTLLRSRTLKYALIFLAWAAAVGFVHMVDEVDFEWRPAVWPYTAPLSFLKLPGIVVIVSVGAIHGFGYWIDDAIVILGSAIFWFLVTITLMAIWSAVRRLLGS